MQLITIAISLTGAGLAAWQAQVARTQAEEATKQRELAEQMRDLTAGQLAEAKEANRIAAESLAMQRAERVAQDDFRIKVIPQGDWAILCNEGRHDLKILEMRVSGPGEVQLVAMPDDMWLDPGSYDAEPFIRAGQDGRVLNTLPGHHVYRDEPFTVRLRVLLNYERHLIQFAGTRGAHLRLGRAAITAHDHS